MKLNFKKLGEGKPVIIMHGVFGSLDNWFTVGKKLAENFKVYLLDLRNHGDSFYDNEFTYEAMANDLVNFIESEHVDNPIIIGHSMGGKVAMKFAVNFPQLFEKLIVVDIAPRAYPPHHQQILKGLQSIDLKSLRSRKDADDQLSEYIPDLGVRQFLLKNLTRDSENNFKWKINLPVIAEKIENIGEGLEDRMASDKPTLFIRGENSDYISNDDSISIISFFPNSEIKTVKNAGHWVHAENPEELIRLVEEFIKN
jgi:esterase